MENHDKIFEQFKSAANNAESKPFPDIDKVWNRVEEKLDRNTLRSENQLWKKIAIAASLLLFITLGYHLINDNNAKSPQQDAVVVTDTVSDEQPEIMELPLPERSEQIVDKPENVLQRQMSEQSEVVTVEKSEMPTDKFKDNTAEPMMMASPAEEMKQAPQYDAPAQKANSVEFVFDHRSGETVVQTQDPLVVVDGKAVSKKDYDKKVKQQLMEMSSDEVEEVVVLNDPLYIINGVRYSEEDLFGPKPTSPYAPLNKQEIESIEVLQGTKAIKEYGEKGRKGVVIIATKNGKPATTRTK